MLSVNIWAVLVSAIVAMALGWLWYGPLFGKAWLFTMGWSQEKMQEMMKKGGAMSYIIMFIGALLMAYVLARAIRYGFVFRGFSPVTAALSYSIANWLGFVAPATIGGVIWEGKSWKWWFLTAGYFLVALIVMGFILAFWA